LLQENKLKLKSLTRIFSAIASLIALTGCGQLGYYAHCTQGHLALLTGRAPIAKLLSDPSTSDELAEQLREFSRIRDFASNELQLPDNDSYRSYSDLQRPYATWNVVAAKEFDLKPLLWCFPIAGCLPYQGFFERQHAESFAAELKKQGYATNGASLRVRSTISAPMWDYFHFMPWRGHSLVIFGAPLDTSWFTSSRSLHDWRIGHCVIQITD
jgi:predicted aminopeptidase